MARLKPAATGGVDGFGSALDLGWETLEWMFAGEDCHGKSLTHNASDGGERNRGEILVAKGTLSDDNENRGKGKRLAGATGGVGGFGSALDLGWETLE